MLLALRRVLDGGRRLPVRIGVNRGNVFAGEIGPPYRSTYSVMGDAVNLAARVMSKAPPGELYCTAGALDRSPTHFRTLRLEPFAAKGKAELVQAWSVGPPVSARDALGARRRVPARRAHRGDRGADRRARRRPRGRGALRRDRRRGRHRQDAAGGRGCASARTSCSGCRRPPRRSRCPRRTPPGASCCARPSASAGRTPTRSCSRGSRRRCARGRRSCCRGCRCSPCRWTSMRRRTPEVDALAPAFRRSRLHATVIAFLRVLLDGPTLLACDDAQYLDEASAELFADIAREVTTAPWLVAARRARGRRLHRARGVRADTPRAGSRSPPTRPAGSPGRRRTPHR